MKKKIYKIFIYPLLLLIARFFYDQKYLKGYYFESFTGWKWVLRGIWFQKILGINKTAKWPVNRLIYIDDPSGIEFHPDDLNNFQHFGCYYSNTNGGKIKIGRGTWIAPNVGIITTNHNFKNLDKHEHPKNVIIGDKCWIGMNSIILPGVELANNTIVGAGSVVTKSFKTPNSIIAGNPAKIIKINNE